ncbi:MAG TPA: O-antigen ligase family protein [Nitrolancea sp.]|nr:O-antigen ligase family protein [Nitrolancea sp.]
MSELTINERRRELDRLKAYSIRLSQRPGTLAIAVGLGLGVYTVGLATLSSHWVPLLAVFAAVPSIGIIVGDIRRLLLFTLIFDVPFSIGRHLYYNLPAAQLGSLGGLGISLTTLALPTLYAMWIGNSLARRGNGTRLWLRPAAALLVYLGFVTFSITQASSKSLSIFEITMIIQSVMIFIYIASTVRTRAEVVYMVTVLAAAVLLESLIMVATDVTHHVFHFAGITTQLDPATAGADSVSRVGGTVGGPNAAAAFLDLLLAPVLSLAIAPVRQIYRLLATGAFLVGCVGLMLTQSRGGWIAVGVSCGIVVGYAWFRGWIPGFAPVLILIVVVFGVYLLRGELLSRFLNPDQGSASSRIPLIKLAFHMIEQHPLFGVGANNFGINISRYATPEFSADWLYTVHNRYLLIWAEDGIGALIAFVIFLLGTLRNGWRCRQISDRALAMLSVGLMAGVLGQMIHMMVDILNGRQQVQPLVIVAGLIAALVAMKRETDPVVVPTSRWSPVETREVPTEASPEVQPVMAMSGIAASPIGSGRR